MKQKILTILMATVASLLIAIPVLAAYSAAITVEEDGTFSYTMYPATASMDVDFMVANGYITATGLDTRVGAGTSYIPHMLADDRLNFATPLVSSGNYNYAFTTGNTALTQFDIIAGQDGYITTADAAAIELGDDFELEWDGYVETTVYDEKFLVRKWGAFEAYISADTDITADILGASAGFPTVAATNTGVNDVAATSHTINLPAGIAAGHLLIVIITGDYTAPPQPTFTFPANWVELYYAEYSGAPGGPVAGAYYKIADGTEGANITVTTSQSTETSHISYRITGYSGVPEATNEIDGNNINPDPPAHTASWGADNNLWIAVEHNDGVQNVVAVPAGYGGGLNAVSGGGGVCTGTAQLNNAVATENPGQYQIAGAEEWIAGTIVVAGAYNVAASVTASGVASGEHTVTVNDEDLVLDFDASANSAIDCTNIGNGAKFWIGIWFKLDSDFGVGAPSQQVLFAKYVNAANRFWALLDPATGTIYYGYDSGGVPQFGINTVQNSWTANTWYHVLFSTGQAIGGGAASNGARMIVDGGAAVTDPNVAAINVAANLILGARFASGSLGIVGNEVQVVMGNDDLTAAEEAALYAGTPPGDETEYWYINERTGTTINSYGSVGTNGTAGNGTSWSATEEERPYYLSIFVDSSWEDGIPMNCVGVPNTAGDYYWGYNDCGLDNDNVTPYLDYITLDVNGAEIVRYQPNDIISGTTLPDRTGAVQNGTFSWGSNPSNVTVTLASLYPDIDPPVSTELEPPDIAGDITDPADMYPADAAMANPGTIFDSIFAEMSTLSNTPQVLFWWFLYGLASVLTVAIMYKMTHHLAISGFAQVVVGGGFIAMGVIPFWFIIMNVIGAVALLTAERVPSV